MGFDLVIFDCDGVLIDSEVISAEVLVGIAAESGVYFDLAHVRDHFLGRSFPTVARLIRESFGVDLPLDFEARYRTRLLDRFGAELNPTPDVTDFIQSLILRSCVATSSSPERAKRSLELAGLDRFFPHVFTARLVAQGKPAPDLFLHAAAAMGARPDRCLVIEDSQPGLTAAEAAGMHVVFFTGGSHLGGLSPSSASSFDMGRRLRAFASWSEIAKAYPDLVRPIPQDPEP